MTTVKRLAPAEYRRAKEVARARAEREKARKRVKRAQAKANQTASATAAPTHAAAEAQRLVDNALEVARAKGWKQGHDQRKKADEDAIIAGFLHMADLAVKMGAKVCTVPIHEVQIIAERLRAAHAPKREVLVEGYKAPPLDNATMKAAVSALMFGTGVLRTTNVPVRGEGKPVFFAHDEPAKAT